MKTLELRKQTVEELNQGLVKLLEEQFKMRMQNATGQIVRPHRFKKLRREIARFNTILHEKQGE